MLDNLGEKNGFYYVLVWGNYFSGCSWQESLGACCMGSLEQAGLLAWGDGRGLFK